MVLWEQKNCSYIFQDWIAIFVVWGNIVFSWICKSRSPAIVSWYIYKHLVTNIQRLSPLRLWVQFLLKRDVLDTTLCDKVCQWLAAGQWFSLGTPDSFTNKTGHHDITAILLKVALNFVTLIPTYIRWIFNFFLSYFPWNPQK